MDTIKVAIRLRPFNKREIALGSVNAVTINDNQVVLNTNSSKDGRNNPKSFTYDCCFDSSNSDKPNYATQQNVYEGLGLDVLESCMAGYNACVFAYGQTGSGKSFTMMGSDDNKGLIPRLCESIFEKINSDTSKNHSFKVEVSYIEIYNEKVRDLLDPSGSKQNLKVREHQLLGPYVDGLTHLAVSSYKDIETILNEGNKSRTVAATNMNAESSRSHAVFCVKVSQTIADEQTGISGEKVSRLSLVDLAGSEKVSKTGVEGERLKEGCNINKSLHTLGQVISALADNASNKTKPKHIPYRDSVLTWLLKDSIGGNSKTVMVSTISPSFDNYEETLSTLRYADRAKRIVNNAVINEDPNAKIIRNLREELEMLKKELEKAKEQISTDALNDRLQQNEKLYKEISKPWDEKLAETEKIQKEWNDALQSMGISVQSSGIKVEKDKYYLVNLNADPSMNELLVYYLKDLTLVGRADAKNKQDIQLLGPGIAPEHCAFYMKNNHVCVAPIKEANTWVNGKIIRGETILHHGDRIVLGTNHFFRINCPIEPENQVDDSSSSELKQTKSDIDFNRAQEEVLLQNKNQQSINGFDNDNSLLNLDDDKSTSSVYSSNGDENALSLELAIQKLEQEYAISTNKTTVSQKKSPTNQRLSSSSSTSSINRSMTKSETTDSGINNTLNKPKPNSNLFTDAVFRKGLQKLREKLLRANSLCREANSLCKEMNKLIRFSVTLQIPAYNLTPNRERDALLSEPAIVAKSKYNNSVESDSTEQQQQFKKSILDMERFENYVFQLRETYTERLRNNLALKDPEEQRIPEILTGSLSYYYNLIGVANLFLDVLYNDVFIPFEYDIPIINQQGEIAGRLRVKLQRLNTDVYFGNSEHDSLGLNSTQEDSESIQSSDNELTNSKRNIIKCRLSIIKAYDLPLNMNNLVFCQYQFWTQAEPVVVRSLEDDSPTQTSVKFDHQADFTIEANEDFMEYCQDGALSIEVMCHRYNLNQSSQELLGDVSANKSQKNQVDLNKLNQMAKYQSLIDAWSEVSKSYELSVKILELNSEGNWKPVELKQNVQNKTGGVYQLKQGQSRQISVSINQTRANSTMWYNGLLFNLEPHRIDKISVGCILGVDAGLSSLDSYQEIDLNKLKEKCRSVLENRKLYLYSQLKQLSESNKNEDEKERYESLCKQLVDLGEEQAAIDAPSDNSHLPGSTIEWTPVGGMEEHVPIIFLDLNEEVLNEKLNEKIDTDDTDNEDSDEISRKYKSKRVLFTCGEECFLKNEHKESGFLNLKLVSWNDSTLVEMVDTEEVKEELNENDLEICNSLDDSKLKAVARWDSSEHRSIYLNRETPLDKKVYLTVKVNLKLKILTQNEKLKRNELKSNQYIDLVLRKRIGVCIYSSNTMSTSKLISFNRFKNILGSGATSSKSKSASKQSLPMNLETSTVTYRVISSIPKLLTEIENRESLAIKAASSITEDLISNMDANQSNRANNNMENSLSHFEQYAKTIQAVDSILKRDRVQQQKALKEAINYFNKNGIPDPNLVQESSESGSSGPQMKKTFSVPNLIKNSFGSLKNLHIINNKQPTSENKNRTTSKINNQNDQVSKHTKPVINNLSKSNLNTNIQLITNEAKSRLSNLGNFMIDTTKLNNLPFKNFIYPENHQSKNQNESQPVIKSSGHPIKANHDIIPTVQLQTSLIEPEESKPVELESVVKKNLSSDTQKILDLFDSVKQEEETSQTTVKPNEEQPNAIADILFQDLNITNNLVEPLIPCTEPEIKKEEEPSKLELVDHLGSSLSLNTNLHTDLHDLNRALSNQSLASTLTNSSIRHKEAPVIEEPIPEWVKENVHVIVTTTSVMNKPGFVKFIGPTKFGTGTWIGVELEQSVGKNDGSVKGVRYFTCPENKGVFVRADKLTLVVNKN